MVDLHQHPEAAPGDRHPGDADPPGRMGRRFHPAVAPVSLLVTGALGAVYLWGTNPHQAGHWLPRCPFNWVTGLDCPACGATRMTYDLLHGDFSAAFQDNAVLLLLGVPAALWLGGRWLYEGLRGRRYRLRLSTLSTTVILGIALVWGIARNVFGLG